MEKINCDDFILLSVLILASTVTFSTGAASCAVGIGAVALIYKIVRKKSLPPIPKEILKIFFIYLSLEFMVALGSIDPVKSFREFAGEIHRLLPFFFAYMTITNKRRMNLFAMAFIVSCLVNDTYALYQHYIEPDERVTGFLHNPNMLASFQLAQIPMLIFFIKREEFPKYLKIISAVVSVLKIFVLIFTLTRGAWLSIGIVGIVFIFLDKRTLKFLTAAVIIFATVFYNSPYLQDRIETLSTMEFSTARERKLMWESAANIIIDYPLNGIGQELFGKMYNSKYISPDAWERETDTRKGHTHPHNNILKVTSEGGILGLTAFIILHGYFFKLAWKIFKEDRSNFIGTTILMILLGLQLEGLTETNLNQTPILREYWLSIGFLLAVKNFLDVKKIDV